MKQAPPLRVRPNPYFALDADGMPAGIVRVDPEVGRPGVIEFIGATLTKTTIEGEVFKGVRNERLPKSYQRRSTAIVFAQDAISIAATPYHIEQVRAGAVLADDKETARACRIWFVDPKVALEQAKARAIAEWKASHDDPPPVDAWAAAIGPEAKRAEPAKTGEDLSLARPWDAPIEPGDKAPKVK
jgi:hypothetical protein